MLRRAVPYLLLLCWLVLFPVTGHDDKYITYWVAERLARTGQLINYNGERVEQSVVLLQIQMLAAVHLVTRVGVPLLAALLSVAAALGCVEAAGRAARKGGG